MSTVVYVRCFFHQTHTRMQLVPIPSFSKYRLLQRDQVVLQHDILTAQVLGIRLTFINTPKSYLKWQLPQRPSAESLGRLHDLAQQLIDLVLLVAHGAIIHPLHIITNDAHAQQLIDAVSQNNEPRNLSRITDVPLHIGTINERIIDAAREIRRGQHHHIRIVLQLVYLLVTQTQESNLSEEGIHHAHSIRGLGSRERRLPRRRQRLDLVYPLVPGTRRTNENEQHGVSAAQEIVDVVKQLHYQLPALAEPLAEETVTVDFD